MRVPDSIAETGQGRNKCLEVGVGRWRQSRRAPQWWYATVLRERGLFFRALSVGWLAEALGGSCSS